jgi:hypothetical protein
MPFENLFQRLHDREMIMPHLEAAIKADKWPDSYNIPVDTSPHYSGKGIYFSPSTHPLLGARQIYYMRHPEYKKLMIPERRTLGQHMRLVMGTAYHSVIQTQLQMAGLIKSDDQIEVPFTIEEHHVRGRIDFIACTPEDPEVVVEVKTQDSRMYQYNKGITPYWDAQLSLNEYAMGKNYGILLLIEFGGNNDIKEIRHQRNDVLLGEIFDKFDYVYSCIERNEPPPACCMPDSKEMQKCPARGECWLSPDPKNWPGNG